MQDASTASMPLRLDGEQVARLGKLLDHALELPPAALEPWLAELARTEPGQATRLREMLAAREQPGFAGFTPASHGVDGVRRQHVPGDRLGAYELMRPLGRGGMAEVWLARRADGAFEREVALKIPLLGHMAEGTSERFSRECRILATLETPGIARLYDAGVDDDVPYIAMEYVPGEHINKWCDSRALDAPARIALFLQVLEAVGKAHAQNVIHRDLKPSNILVNTQGEVRLLDFGVARLLMTETNGDSLTRTYGRALTPEYASPEMLRGDPIDMRTDIYSAGVVLFQLLTGARPGARTTASTQAHANLPVALREVLQKALSASQEDRYPDAAAFAAALRPHALPPRRRQHWWLAAAALVLLGAGIWYFQGRFATSVVAPAAAVATPALAVLPFTDLSQARDQEYLADGLAEEILNQLAQVESLRLMARTSSFSFKGSSEDSRAIGRQLGVTHLLQGSVRKDGDQLRISTQLINASDGTQLWSKTYAREFKDVLAVQDEISRDVATALSIKLDVGALTRVAGGTTNIQAYEKFLQARAELAKENPGSWRTAQGLFREAAELDPGFGAAQMGLVRTLDGSVRSTSPSDPATMEIADILARSARATPDAPWVLNLQANYQLAHHRWAQVDATVQAIFRTPYGSRREIDPFGTYPAIYLKWLWLFNVGRVAESLRINEEWAQDDPLGSWASTNVLYQLPYAGRDAEMPAEYARNRKLTGGKTSYYTEWSMLFHLLREANPNPAQISAQLTRLNATANGNGTPDTLDVAVLGNLGDPQALRATLRGALAAPQHNHSLGYIAAYADAFGDRDLALAAIRKEAVDPVAYTPFRLPWVLWYPYKTGLRADPRFKDIMREIGLVDYWRQTGNWGDFCRPLGADDFECR
jgi:serine/threonine protein kinase